MIAGSLTLPIVRINAVLGDSTSSVSYVGLVTLNNGEQANQIHIATLFSLSLVPGLPSAIGTDQPEFLYHGE
jgi:hypothetical protein